MAHDSSGPVESLEKDHVRSLDLGCVCVREREHKQFFSEVHAAGCLSFPIIDK